MHSPQLENFAQAFSTHSSGCVRVCACGRTFFHDDEHGYSWEEGELEALRASPKATSTMDYAVETLIFRGIEYCVDCDCWHPIAKSAIAFFDLAGQGIAEFFRLEKERKQHEADQSPLIDEGAKS